MHDDINNNSTSRFSSYLILMFCMLHEMLIFHHQKIQSIDMVGTNLELVSISTGGDKKDNIMFRKC